jgi:uncharacterized protein (TIGR02453 family)
MHREFTGFSPDTFAFFRELAENNNKDWFSRNRERYETRVTGAFRALLADLEPFLLNLNPQFETAGKTNRNFSRINRDIRFSRDKRPYKSNYYLYVFDRRRDRDTDGRLYVGLSAECVTVGFSIYSGGRNADDAMVKIFRPRIKAHRGELEGLVERTVRRPRYETYWHRQEKGEWALHPRLPRRDDDWLTLQAWIVRRVFPSGSRVVKAPEFVRQVENIFSQVYPLYLFTASSGRNWNADLARAARRASRA